MSKPEISQEILLEFSQKESTGSCTFRPEDLPLNPLRSKYCTIKGKFRSRDRWYQFPKKQSLYIDKSRCRMGLSLPLESGQFRKVILSPGRKQWDLGRTQQVFHGTDVLSLQILMVTMR